MNDLFKGKKPFIYYPSSIWAIPAMLSIYSLIRNYKQGEELNILVINNNFSENLKSLIKRNEVYWNNYRPVTIEFFDINYFKPDMDLLRNNISVKRLNITPETFFRLWIPNIVDSDVAVSLDTDMIITKDISPLWDYNFDGDLYIRGCKHLPNRNLTYVEWLGDRPNTYINAGVLLWNLKAMREHNLVAEFEKEFHSDTILDEEVINRVCYGHIGNIPVEYNSHRCVRELKEPTLNYTAEDLDALHNHYRIMHYTSKWKPWIIACSEDEAYNNILQEVTNNGLLTSDEYYQWRKTLEWPGVDKTRKVVE